MAHVGRFSGYPRGMVLVKDALTCFNNQPLEQIPYRVQMVMAGKATPILSGMILAFEMFMSKWEWISELHQRLSRWIDVGLHLAMHYYKCMDWTKAYIMAMGEYHENNYFIFLMAISLESQHPHDWDSSEVATWVHPGCQRENQGNGKLYHLYLQTYTYHKDIS